VKFHPDIEENRKVRIDSVMDRDWEGRIWLRVPGLTYLNLTALCSLRYCGTSNLEDWARRMFCDDTTSRRFPDMAAYDFGGTACEL